MYKPHIAQHQHPLLVERQTGLVARALDWGIGDLDSISEADLLCTGEQITSLLCAFPTVSRLSI